MSEVVVVVVRPNGPGVVYEEERKQMTGAVSE